MSDKGVVVSVDNGVGKDATVLSFSKIENGVITVTHAVEVKSKREAEGWMQLLAIGIDRNRIIMA